MFTDTRAEAKRILGSFHRGEWLAIGKMTACGAVALAVAYGGQALGMDPLDGLADGGRAALGIMIFAALLWVTEAIPAFAVALLVIGLQIAILGNPGGVWAAEGDTKAWTAFVKPWASPVMWLFLGGFVLAHACSKTELDKWLAGSVLGRFATNPAKLMASIMGITFVFSMFMSNTATAAMMIAVTAPILKKMPKGSKLAKGLVLAVAASANLGGMGTIIGTPPNAIAAGQLAGEVDFMSWMMVAVPPAIILISVVYGFLWLVYVRGETFDTSNLDSKVSNDPIDRRQRILVMVVFSATVILWITESFTGIPSPVVSFIPIVGLAVLGVIESKDIRELPWDVLLLLAGGLSLGVGVESTGLANWIVGNIPSGLGAVAVAFVFSIMGLVLSNLMSNTAAAALLIPLASSLVVDDSKALVVVAVAVSCSAAMALPISTPPNAIAYSSGRLSSRDFMIPGLIAAAGIVVVIPWLIFTL